MDINPLIYGLSSRVKLEDLGENNIAVVKLIKSRIIQKDAAKIVDIANQIKSVNPDLEVSLICSKNICSKSLVLLDKEGVSLRLID